MKLHLNLANIVFGRGFTMLGRLRWCERRACGLSTLLMQCSPLCWHESPTGDLKIKIPMSKSWIGKPGPGLMV
jgi:hypothetical protein